MIGEQEIKDGIAEQRELYERVVERVDETAVDTRSLDDFCSNMGVDFDALYTSVESYVAANPMVMLMPQVLGVRMFLLGVVLGRDHRP